MEKGNVNSKKDGLGIASMVLGILSLVPGMCIPVLAIILGTLALIFGGFALFRKNNQKGCAIAGCVMAIVSILVLMTMSIGNYIQEKKKESSKINWSEIELSQSIPEIDRKRGEIVQNTSNLAEITIYKLSEEKFNEYVKKCIDEGYNFEIEYGDSNKNFKAYNENGDKIMVGRNSNGDVNIRFEVSRKKSMKEFEWDTKGVWNNIPKTKSNLGEIITNNDKKLAMYIGNITQEEYKEYVKLCENKGFTLEYNQDDKHFKAKNIEGCELSLDYEGGKVMYISIDASNSKNENNTQVEKSESEEASARQDEAEKDIASTQKDTKNEIRSDFKAAMDSYENFMNEYVEFMKKYKESNGSDMSLLSDYSKYMSKYSEFCNKYNEWGNKDLNTAETNYYIEVQTRVTKKLQEIL